MKPEPIPFTEDELAILNELRVVILIEQNPQTNKYNQLRLTHKQFSVISNAIMGCAEKHGNTIKNYMGGEVYRLSTEIQTFYENPAK